MRCTILMMLATATTLVSAEDRPPFFVAGGYGLLDGDLRALTQKFPWIAQVGWGENQAALMGAPSLDLEWIHAQGNGNKFDSWGITYNERVQLSDSLYFGFGIGSYYSRLKVTASDGSVIKDGERWYPGGRVMLGSYLYGGNWGALFAEVGYTQRFKVEGVEANCLSLTAGLWF